MGKSIAVKQGVVFKEFNDYCLAFLFALKKICDKFGKSLVITSANDSTHSQNSYHYKNLAWDVRLHDLKPAFWYVLQSELRKALPPYYDILVESPDDPDNVHCHIEADMTKAGDYFLEDVEDN
jgi:hypothetical protein